MNDPQWEGQWRIKPRWWLGAFAVSVTFYALMALLIIRWW